MKASENSVKAARLFGLLGMISLLSYAAAVIFAPLAYSGYDSLSQAVSDLSADTAPSRVLWNQLSTLYMPCGIVCCTFCAFAVRGYLNRTLRCGVYLFAVMNWFSAVGYAMFPLPNSGKPEGFQGVMHLVITAAVVALSVVSLVLIIFGGFRKKTLPSLAVFAAVALTAMFVGAVGTGVLPAEYFGIPERFSVFSATGFNAVLGGYLFFGKLEKEAPEPQKGDERK